MSRSLTKGERCLLEADTAPNVSSVLPDALRRERVVSFDLQQFDVYGAAAELLACTSKVGVFTESKSSRRHEIESYRVRIDVFRNFGARQVSPAACFQRLSLQQKEPRDDVGHMLD